MLYLGQKELNGNFDFYVNRLNREFPSSPYTFSVNNPDAASGNMAYLESSKRYEQAYDAYYSGRYTDSRSLIRSSLVEFPLTRNTEKLLLLDAMVTGKLESRDNFRAKLEEFIQNSKEAELTTLAKKMLQPLLSQEELIAMEKGITSEQDSSQLVTTPIAEEKRPDVPADSPYKVNESQTHIFVIALAPSEVEAAKNLLGDLENFHAQAFSNARLRTGNMNMNQENSIYIISPFSNSEKALEYYKKFSEEFKSTGLTQQAKSKSFFISIENFQTLNKTKNLEEYLIFFRSLYL
jgi:hypothetical protein